MARKKSKMPPRNKKNFRPTKSGAGMTEAGVKAYRRANPGSKLKTAVTGKVKKGFDIHVVSRKDKLEEHFLLNGNESCVPLEVAATMTPLEE